MFWLFPSDTIPVFSHLPNYFSFITKWKYSQHSVSPDSTSTYSSNQGLEIFWKKIGPGNRTVWPLYLIFSFHVMVCYVSYTQILIILKILKLNLGNFLGYIRILGLFQIVRSSVRLQLRGPRWGNRCSEVAANAEREKQDNLWQPRGVRWGGRWEGGSGGRGHCCTCG